LFIVLMMYTIDAMLLYCKCYMFIILTVKITVLWFFLNGQVYNLS